ncbi:MAG: glutamyl-tRNA reductase [Treponema sp.]|jgi:glutamyl-tRNA reductase|nr:glutamyl-tRNA reductase [Treponema sp.]
MNIAMAGIDHQRAGLGEREPFAFTPHSLLQSLEQTAKAHPKLGCVIISTCNRTEIWVSGKAEIEPEKLLCDLKGLPFEENRGLFQRREGAEAEAHLFLLAGGLESQILGENQILAQVKEAREIARQAGSIDSVLDRLFQMAVACAKRIKTETGITRANSTTAAAAADYIASRHPNLEGLRCLVIGNGVIGRQTAELLSRRGCSVTITLRQHKQNLSLAPQGCGVVDYGDRYEALPHNDVVISATTSPHYTLSLENTAKIWDNRPRLFIDLAVPRDMDGGLAGLSGLTLVDIDQLSGEGHAGIDEGERKKIEGILHEGIDEFTAWRSFREHTGSIAYIRKTVSTEIVTRLDRAIRSLTQDAEAAEKLRIALDHAAQMALGKMLFGLRETLDSGAWEPCFEALLEAAGAKPETEAAMGREHSRG